MVVDPRICGGAAGTAGKSEQEGKKHHWCQFYQFFYFHRSHLFVVYQYIEKNAAVLSNAALAIKRILKLYKSIT
jgi:hypothetical protein